MSDRSQSARAKVLLVEDRETLRRSFARLLTERSYEVQEAPDLARARAELENHPPDVVLTDLKLPDGEGTELLSLCQQLPKPPPVILLTAYGSVETAVQAMRRGAYDFLTKPVDSEHLLLVTQRALQDSARRWRLEALASVEDEPTLLGDNAPFREVVHRACTAAATDTTVLLLGESGTGKELLARLIHQRSTRKDGVFVPVNCAAISASLAESALFGHERGAFTGARERHRGWFELAHGGTLFLDEIGDLEHGLQGKFLRVLEDGMLQRVGGSQWLKVNVRVIAASNRDLSTDVAAGRFRSDLYYRLAVFPLVLPPLRERLDDIPILALHLLNRHSKALGRGQLSLSVSALDALAHYHWPGNIRELANVLERTAILAREPLITPEMLPPLQRLSVETVPGEDLSLPRQVAAVVERVEREAITRALRKTSGRRSEAARLLGITYRTLLNKLNSYDMESPKGAPHTRGGE
ncbi:sigma-54-dependent Fis family transcriptional regulator [Candidatus Fermentibacteria bacterium]|nr:sigma-54-dependent Fis family transcriptional regulator [Candidatus Fermentibacteria bacterium]